MRGVEVTAVADVDEARLGKAKRLVSDARALGDYRELLQLDNVDAVVIALPTALHADAAVAALERGRHVYLEKPLASTLDDATRVVEAWRRSGLVGMTGFNLRSNGLYQQLKLHVSSGRLGELVGARSVFSIAERSLPDWKRSRRSGGGALLDLGSHHVDLVRFLFGREIESVSAELHSHRSEDDVAAVQMRLAGGLIVQSMFSITSVAEDRFEVYGREGRAVVDHLGSLGAEVSGVFPHSRIGRWMRAPAKLVRLPYAVQKLRSPAREPSYRTAFARFVAAVRGEGPVAPDFDDGLRCMQIIAAAEESARTGRACRLGGEGEGS